MLKVNSKHEYEDLNERDPNFNMDSKMNSMNNKSTKKLDRLDEMEKEFDKYLDVFNTTNNPAKNQSILSNNLNVGTAGNIGSDGLSKFKMNKKQQSDMVHNHQLEMTGKTKFAMIDELDKFVGQSRSDLLNNKDTLLSNNLNYSKRYVDYKNNLDVIYDNDNDNNKEKRLNNND